LQNFNATTVLQWKKAMNQTVIFMFSEHMLLYSLRYKHEI